MMGAWPHVGNCVIARVQLSNGNKLSRGYGVLLMGQGAGAGNILARFRALFCKVRGDGRPNGGNGGQNWMEDRSEQGMPNVGNYSRRAWGAGLCDGGGVEWRGGWLVTRGVTGPVQGTLVGWTRDEEEADCWAKRTPQQEGRISPRRHGTRVGLGGWSWSCRGTRSYLLGERECGRVKKRWDRSKCQQWRFSGRSKWSPRGSAGGQGRVAATQGQAAATPRTGWGRGKHRGRGAPCFLTDVRSQGQVFDQGPS